MQGETDELRARARADVEQIEELAPATAPSLPNAWLQRQATPGPWRRARVQVSFPVADIGDNLPTLAATVAGNLYDLGELTGIRLESLSIPESYRQRFELPRHGIAGTRRLTGVDEGPLIGTIIKPNVGLSPQQTAHLAAQLCRAGVDFIKDDEVCANPDHAPLAQRAPAVMAEVRRHRVRTGKQVMVAFNISDEMTAMCRHAELVAHEGGTCVMVSLNWCGLSAVQALRRQSGLAIHGHRNGYGAFSRHPLLGMSFNAYQARRSWRKSSRAGSQLRAATRPARDPGARLLGPQPSRPDRAGCRPVQAARRFPSDRWHGSDVEGRADGPAGRLREAARDSLSR